MVGNVRLGSKKALVMVWSQLFQPIRLHKSAAHRKPEITEPSVI